MFLYLRLEQRPKGGLVWCLRQVTVPFWPNPEAFPALQEDSLLGWTEVGWEATALDRNTCPVPIAISQCWGPGGPWNCTGKGKNPGAKKTECLLLKRRGHMPVGWMKGGEWGGPRVRQAVSASHDLDTGWLKLQLSVGFGEQVLEAAGNEGVPREKRKAESLVLLTLLKAGKGLGRVGTQGCPLPSPGGAG